MSEAIISVRKGVESPIPTDSSNCDETECSDVHLKGEEKWVFLGGVRCKRLGMIFLALLVVIVVFISIGLVLRAGGDINLFIKLRKSGITRDIDFSYNEKSDIGASSFSCYVDEQCLASLEAGGFQAHEDSASDFNRRNAVRQGMLFIGVVSAITSVYVAKKACEELVGDWTGKDSLQDCVYFASTESNEGIGNDDVVLTDSEELSGGSEEEEEIQEYSCTGHCYPSTFTSGGVIAAVKKVGLKCEDLITSGTVKVVSNSQRKHWMKNEKGRGGVRVGKGEGGALRLNQFAKSKFSKETLTPFCKQKSRTKIPYVKKQYTSEGGTYIGHIWRNLCLSNGNVRSKYTNISCKIIR